ncbi:MAG: hypothetical protein K1X66_08655 [Verrucomicrobiae bacterium]|nr:hypothetical protein [Verrucomicrobiae bacterium]
MEKANIPSPLKIINVAGNQTANIQIAEFYQNVTYAGSIATLKPNQPQSFYVCFEFPGSTDKPTIEATIEVSNPSDPSQPLEKLTITLHRDPNNFGRFISENLLMVSSRNADQIPTANHPNDGPLDQTLYGQINSTITVSISDTSITPPNSIERTTYQISASIRPKDVVVVQPIIVHDENGNPLATEVQLKQLINELRNGMALTGTQVIVEGAPTTVKTSDLGITFQDGLDEQEKQKLTDAILSKPSNPPHIKVALLGHTDLGPTTTTHHYKLDATGKQTGHPVVFAQNTTQAPFLAQNFELIRKTNTALANLNADPNYLLFKQPPANATPQSSKTHSRDIFATSPPQQQVPPTPSPTP